MDEKGNEKMVLFNMLVLWLDEKTYLTEEEKRIWLKISLTCNRELSLLYKMYHSARQEGRRVESRRNKIIYERKGRQDRISSNDESIVLFKPEMMELLAGTISLLEGIYPLGTVLELKMHYSDQEKKEQHVQVVITHRFLSLPGEEYYFEYAGVSYPTGMPTSSELLFFTNESVHRLVYRGYEDGREKSFVMGMKKKLILDEDKASISFSKNNQRYKQFVHNGGEKNE